MIDLIPADLLDYIQTAEELIAATVAGLPEPDARRVHYDAFSAMSPSPIVPKTLLPSHLQELIDRVVEGDYDRIGDPTNVEIARAMIEAIMDTHGVPSNLAGAVILALFGKEYLASMLPPDAVEIAKQAAGLEDTTTVAIVIARYRRAGYNDLRQKTFYAGVRRGHAQNNLF